MVREGSVVSAMSDAQRLQLQHDRLRTKAISLFLADHREALLRNLRKVRSMDHNTKRRALVAEARKKFKEEADSVRNRYMILASAKVQDGGQDAKQATKQGHSIDPHLGPKSSSSEMHTQTPVKRQKVAEALAVAPRNKGLSTITTEVDPAKVDSGKDFGRNGVRTAALRGRLVDCADCLREIYGDAGGFETVAGGLRILEKVSVATWKGDDTVKVAAILGLAAKLTQTLEDTDRVRTLWAAIAGKRREHLVRDLEQKVFLVWARDSLESDYVPKVVQ